MTQDTGNIIHESRHTSIYLYLTASYHDACFQKAADPDKVLLYSCITQNVGSEQAPWPYYIYRSNTASHIIAIILSVRTYNNGVKR